MSNKPSYAQLENRLSELEKENRNLNRLYEAATEIGSNLSLEDTLESITSHIIKIFDCSGCSISLWLRDKNQLKTLIDSDKFYPDEVDKPGLIYDLKKYPETLNALKTGQTYHVQIDDPVADKAEIALMKEQEIFETLVLPLATGNRALGLLEIYNDVKFRNFTKREIRLAETLAVKAAIALENAHLYKAAQFEINNRKLAAEALLREKEKLQDALAEIKTLSGMLPICASCKKIRDDKGYWNQIEGYIERHSEALFSHSLCPECMDKLYGDEDWYKKEDIDK